MPDCFYYIERTLKKNDGFTIDEVFVMRSTTCPARSGTLICPEKKRVLKAPFAWIDRHYLFHNFLARLSQHENLLYLFLVLAADRDGISYYAYDKICTILKLDADDYIQARNGLLQKQLIAFDGSQFQVLALPGKWPQLQHQQQRQVQHKTNDAQALGAILGRLAQQSGKLGSPDRDKNLA